jgi:predicted DNA-binding protein
MTSRKQLSFRVSPELYQQFTEKVETEGKQSGKVLEQLVEAYVNGDIPDGSNEVASSNNGRDEDIKKLVADEVENVTKELREEIDQLRQMVVNGSKLVEQPENGQSDKVIADGSNKVASAVNQDATKVVADDSNQLEITNKDSADQLESYLHDYFELGVESLVEEIAHEASVSKQLARNRIKGKKKKKLSEADKRVLKELENWEEFEPGKWRWIDNDN